MSEIVKGIVKCKKCGKGADVDMSVVLTSNPPQYKAKCKHCGETFCCFQSEVSFVLESKDGLYAGSNNWINAIVPSDYHYLWQKANQCNHNIDVKMVNGDYVSFCTKCGAILDKKSSWHY